jgi:hypothetical protein
MPSPIATTQNAPMTADDTPTPDRKPKAQPRSMVRRMTRSPMGPSASANAKPIARPRRKSPGIRLAEAARPRGQVGGGSDAFGPPVPITNTPVIVA